jgi:hypothetical protein
MDTGSFLLSLLASTHCRAFRYIGRESESVYSPLPYFERGLYCSVLFQEPVLGLPDTLIFGCIALHGYSGCPICSGYLRVHVRIYVATVPVLCPRCHMVRST